MNYEATPSTLAALVAKAAPGDVLTLGPGSYGDVRISGGEGLTIKASSGAFLRSLILTKSKTIRLEGLTVQLTPRADTVSWSAAVLISGCQDVAMIGGHLIGGPAVAGVAPDAPKTEASGNVIGWPTGKGVDITKSSRVTISGVDVTTFDRGIGMSAVEDVDVRGCSISGLRRTAISGAGVQRVTIEGNRLGAARPWRWSETPVGDHGDYIAFWTDANYQTGPTEGLVIRGNVADQGDGGAILGMWLQGGALGFKDPLIEGNVFLIGNGQGITLKDCQGGRVLNNTLLQSSGGPKDGPVILYTGATRDVFAAGNIAAAIHDMTTTKTGTNTLAGDNLLVQRTDPTKPGHFGDEAVVKVRAAGVVGAATAARQSIFGEKPPVIAEPPPTRDELRDLIRQSTVVKQEALKTKGRISFDWKTPAEADAFLAAVNALRAAA